MWPTKPVAIADRRTIDEFPPDVAHRLRNDPAVHLSLGPDYLEPAASGKCEVVIKTPGIPASSDAIVKAQKAGSILTTQSRIFLSNYPLQKIIGITGTKGKSTTASLIYE